MKASRCCYVPLCLLCLICFLFEESAVSLGRSLCVILWRLFGFQQAHFEQSSHHSFCVSGSKPLGFHLLFSWAAAFVTNLYFELSFRKVLFLSISSMHFMHFKYHIHIYKYLSFKNSCWQKLPSL